MTATTVRVCVCGHDEARHLDHYRPRVECVVCGCLEYRPVDVEPGTVGVTVTVGWLIILAVMVFFWGAVLWGFTKWLGA